jgi:hypothetical protein
LLDRLIGNFLERVFVCVFFILLLLLFYGCLLGAFLAELAITRRVPSGRARAPPVPRLSQLS